MINPYVRKRFDVTDTVKYFKKTVILNNQYPYKDNSSTINFVLNPPINADFFRVKSIQVPLNSIVTFEDLEIEIRFLIGHRRTFFGISYRVISIIFPISGGLDLLDLTSYLNVKFFEYMRANPVPNEDEYTLDFSTTDDLSLHELKESIFDYELIDDQVDVPSDALPDLEFIVSPKAKFLIDAIHFNQYWTDTVNYEDPSLSNNCQFLQVGFRFFSSSLDAIYRISQICGLPARTYLNVVNCDSDYKQNFNPYPSVYPLVYGYGTVTSSALEDKCTGFSIDFASGSASINVRVDSMFLLRSNSLSSGRMLSAYDVYNYSSIKNYSNNIIGSITVANNAFDTWAIYEDDGPAIPENMTPLQSPSFDSIDLFFTSIYDVKPLVYSFPYTVVLEFLTQHPLT